MIAEDNLTLYNCNNNYILCGRLETALRGTDDVEPIGQTESERNDGNFRALLIENANEV
jgi:hypothetical protein